MSSIKSGSSRSSRRTSTLAVNGGFTKGGDLTLRSLDGIEFTVHSTIMSLASPVFKDMFTVGTKQTAITLAETADTIALMLRFIYPKPVPVISEFDEWARAMHVANKYQLRGMKSHLRGLLSQETSPVSVHNYPLRGLEAAFSYGFKAETSLAAHVAAYYFDFRTVDNLVTLAKTLPALTPWVKLIGEPSVKNKIFMDVLFNFHQSPMRLSTSQCAQYLCPNCKPTYSKGSHHSPPEWQARWAHNAFQELQSRPMKEWPEIFGLPFFYTALYKGGELSIGKCTCPQWFTWDRTGFLQWANEVFEVLQVRLAWIDQLMLLS